MIHPALFPTTLYKYRDWNINLHKTLLLKNEIFLGSAKFFNDPFDSTVPIRYDTLTKEEIFKRNIRYLKKTQPNLKRNELRRLSREQEKKKLYKNPNHLKWFYQYQKNYYSEKFGICSLTEDPKNIVMWSHYANSHKGICVGFDVEKLLEARRLVHKKARLLFDLYKVDYHLDYPFLDLRQLEANEPEQYRVTPLLKKSTSWAYEKEYRIILLNGANITVELPDGVISMIVLGCKMKDSHKDEIKNALKERHSNIELFQAIMKEESFGLDFISIKYR